MLIIIIAIVGGLLLFIPKKTDKSESKNSLPSGGTNQVTLPDKGFSPESITIKKGGTVSWINASSKSGTVNSASHPNHNLHRFLNLGEFPSGSSFEAIFEKEGTYSYHNHLNPQQQGTVVVK